VFFDVGIEVKECRARVGEEEDPSSMEVRALNLMETSLSLE
jgi:hypothetical protein